MSEDVDRLARMQHEVAAVGTLTLVRWRDGDPTVMALGHTGLHGACVSWQPRSFAYRAGYSVGSTAG